MRKYRNILAVGAFYIRIIKRSSEYSLELKNNNYGANISKLFTTKKQLFLKLKRKKIIANKSRCGKKLLLSEDNFLLTAKNNLDITTKDLKNNLN